MLRFFSGGTLGQALQLTSADVVAAVRLSVGRRMKTWRAALTNFVVVFVFISFGERGTGWPSATDLVLRLVYSALFVAFFTALFPRLLAAYAGPKQFRSSPSLQRAREVDVSADGVVLSDDGGRQIIRWTDIVDLAEDDRVMLAFLSAHGFVIFPKTSLPSDLIERIGAGWRASRAGHHG